MSFGCFQRNALSLSIVLQKKVAWDNLASTGFLWSNSDQWTKKLCRLGCEVYGVFWLLPING